jgi:mRNA interferase MazF
MTGYDFGDVVLVPFPFTDQSAVKRRPAVAVSSPSLSSGPPRPSDHGDYQSTTLSLSVGEVQVHDWQGAGLLKPSVLKPILTTIDPALVLKKLGRLTETDQSALRQALRTMLG